MSDTQFAIILHKTRGTGCVADSSPHSQPVVSQTQFSSSSSRPASTVAATIQAAPRAPPAHSAPHIHRPQIFQPTTPPPLSLSSSSVLWIVVGSIPQSTTFRGIQSRLLNRTILISALLSY
ncbi:hypothetical protein DdX_10415 [Ditylenchus destructor]|uniref:Uncharacterized protein n=1 Tax=Ditylenchus destructor TaxID=166010 RepID=A0AAD4R5N8_9BILA|nr:hypothetical protein DdX_10415 [Ditylenchus destructor]